MNARILHSTNPHHRQKNMGFPINGIEPIWKNELRKQHWSKSISTRMKLGAPTVCLQASGCGVLFLTRLQAPCENPAFS